MLTEEVQPVVDQGDIGFVVALMDRKRLKQLPTLLCLDHGASLEGTSLTKGLIELNKLAAQRWGNSYYINTWDDHYPGHVCAVALPVRYQDGDRYHPKDLIFVCPECGYKCRPEEVRVDSLDMTVLVKCPRGCILETLDLSELVDTSPVGPQGREVDAGDEGRDGNED